MIINGTVLIIYRKNVCLSVQSAFNNFYGIKVENGLSERERDFYGIKVENGLSERERER